MKTRKRQYHIPGKPTDEDLRRCYVDQQMTVQEIGEQFHYKQTYVYELLARAGIELRDKEKWEERWRGEGVVDKETLYQLHVVQGLTAVRIAQMYGCHNATISRLIKEHDLDPERQLINIPSTPPVEYADLNQLYTTERWSCRMIAEKYHVSNATAGRWLQFYGIPLRSGLHKGRPKHTYQRTAIPTTRFGLEFSAEERSAILERDGWVCQMPQCDCSERYMLEVHHILPVNHGGTNAQDNGITLCRSCHISIKNKEMQYVALFQHILTSTL